MPATIPIAQGPRVQEQVLQPTRVSADAFGAAVGRQMQQAGEGLQRASVVLDRIQERADVEAAFRAETQMQSDFLEYSMAARNRKGVNAKGLVNETDLWWSEAQQRYEGGLTGRAKRMLAKNAARVRQNGIQAMFRYENQETEKALMESWTASKNVAISAAAQNPDPEVIASTVQILSEKNRYWAAREGWDAARLEAMQLEDTTALHTSVLREMVNTTGGGERAQAYFDRYSSQIDGKQHGQIKPIINKAVLGERASDIAEQLSGQPVSAALQQIGQIEDPELRKAARQQYMLNQRDEEAIRNAQQREASDAVWAAVAQGRKPGAGMVAAMSGKEQLQLRKYYEARAKGVAGQQQGTVFARQTDYEALDHAQMLIEAGDITDPRQLLPYMPMVKETDYRALRKAVQTQGDLKPSDVKRVFLDRMGKTQAKLNNNEQDEYLAFQEWAADRARDSNRGQDLEKFADEWFMSGYRTEKGLVDRIPFVNRNASTRGEAITRGQDDFVVRTPARVQDDVAAAAALVNLAGGGSAAAPASRGEVDKFYTDNYSDAKNWLEAHGQGASPAGVAAVTILRENKKAVTPANVNAVLEQLGSLND